MYLVYIWCREKVSDVLTDITKSPIAIKTEGSRVYKPLIQPSSNKSRSIDCAMCARGMCSIHSLRLAPNKYFTTLFFRSACGYENM